MGATGIRLYHRDTFDRIQLLCFQCEISFPNATERTSALYESPHSYMRGVRHGASRRTRFRNPLDFKWISDFRMDFWNSGFQSGFLDFKVDFCISKWISRGISGFQANFWISKRISGFQANFWISKRISGFHLNRYYSKIQLKYTHDSSTAFLSACMLTEYKVTGTSPLHSAQACSLIVIHIRIL